MRKYFIILQLLLTIIACEKVENKPNAKVCFDYSPGADLKVGDTIVFSNCSENSMNYNWDFGDNNSSIEKNPKHVYDKIGSYEVRLVANNNSITSISKTIEIHEQQKIVIGDYSIKNLSLTVNQSEFKWVYKNLADILYIDCNNDSIKDFEFSVISEWVQGGTLLREKIFKIVPLTQNVEISTDSIMNPIAYKLGDTLKLDGNWNNGEIILYKKTITSGPFEKITYAITGIWNKVSESYMGIKIDGKYLGWIKIDVQPKIFIYEWARIK